MKNNIRGKFTIGDFFRIDEDDVDYVSFAVKDDKVTLPELIVDDIVSQGFDPINKSDVNQYWRSKGIEV